MVDLTQEEIKNLLIILEQSNFKIKDASMIIPLWNKLTAARTIEAEVVKPTPVDTVK